MFFVYLYIYSFEPSFPWYEDILRTSDIPYRSLAGVKKAFIIFFSLSFSLFHDLSGILTPLFSWHITKPASSEQKKTTKMLFTYLYVSPFFLLHDSNKTPYILQPALSTSFSSPQTHGNLQHEPRRKRLS